MTIRYTICPVESQRISRTLIRDEDWIKKLFEQLEKDGLEGRLYNVPTGERVLLYQSVYGPDEFSLTYFISTGKNSGYFSQYNAWPGGGHHLSFAEFKFE